jgi:glycine hydroxymethyltransferase
LSRDLADRLRASLAEQERLLRTSIVLNPVENFPFEEDLASLAGPLHGLYNTDKVRSRNERAQTPLQFAGRQALEADARTIYDAWAEALHAEDVTLRVLSGLHAHIVLFMSMARAGQTVLLLPVEAGGHVSGQAILERLGLVVRHMDVDEAGMCVDLERTIERARADPPDFVFVDRSEGLVFEDLSALAGVARDRTVFDASQYLTNVISGEHANPLDWGFDLMIASIHKNFPGPQKALIATRELDDRWRDILRGVSTYVSNMHSTSTYAAGLTLARSEWLRSYSRRALELAVLLEDALAERGVPVVRRRRDRPPTHHVWIREADRAAAFATFERLESCRIHTNFRQLPYSLGFGLRLGTTAAARIGLMPSDVGRLAELIAEIRRWGATAELRDEARAFAGAVWSHH